MRSSFALALFSVAATQVGCSQARADRNANGTVQLLLGREGELARGEEALGSFSLDGLYNGHHARVSLSHALHRALRVSMPPGSYILRWERDDEGEDAMEANLSLTRSDIDVFRMVLVVPARLTTIKVHLSSHSQQARQAPALSAHDAPTAL